MEMNPPRTASEATNEYQTYHTEAPCVPSNTVADIYLK